jgi:hypothetical protein
VGKAALAACAKKASTIAAATGRTRAEDAIAVKAACRQGFAMGIGCSLKADPKADKQQLEVAQL